jgi:hypothetical protein
MTEHTFCTLTPLLKTSSQSLKQTSVQIADKQESSAFLLPPDNRQAGDSDGEVLTCRQDEKGNPD